MNQAAQNRTRFRWRICALLFFLTVISYVDRQIIGILKPMLEQELGWNEIDYANIVLSFQVAYAAGYLFAGRLIDKVGVRGGLGWSLGIWSLFTIAHSLAGSVISFCIMRAGLGLGEGGTFPGAIKAVREWFPGKERALATGIFNAGSSAGAIVTPLAVPWIAVHLGWQVAFILAGLAGFALLVVWLRVYQSPERHPRVSPEELAYIQDNPDDPAPGAQEGIGWLQILGRRQTWGFVIPRAITSPIWWFCLFWIPDFLYKTQGITLLQLGGPLLAIYLISDVGSVGGGWIALRMVKAGMTVRQARLGAMLSCALFGLPLFFVPGIDSLWLVTLLIGLAAAAHQGWAANLFTLVSDTMPRNTVSSIVGIGGVAAAVGGVIAAKATGYLLETTGDYSPIFYYASFCYYLALPIIVLLTRRPGERL